MTYIDYMWIFPDSNIPKHLTLIMMIYSSMANSYQYTLDSTNTGPPINENSVQTSKVNICCHTKISFLTFGNADITSAVFAGKYFLFLFVFFFQDQISQFQEKIALFIGLHCDKNHINLSKRIQGC